MGGSKRRAAAGRPQTMTQRSGHGLERRSKGMERRIPVRVFGTEWTLRRRGPQPPFWSFQGVGFSKGRGKFEIPLPFDGSLVTFCPHRKSLARGRNIPQLPFPDIPGGPVWDRPLRREIKPGWRADNIRPYGITSARHPAGAQCAPLRTAGQGLSTSLYYKASVRSFTYYSILSEKEIKSESCKRIIRIGYEVVRAD